MAARKAGSLAAPKLEPRGERKEIGGLGNVIAPAWPESVKFESIGEVHRINVTDAKKAPVLDDRNRQRKWGDGSPMEQLVVIGKVDDAERALFISGQSMRAAFRQALKEADVNGIARGDILDVAWTGEEELFDDDGNPAKDADGKPMNARKLYEMVIYV